MKKTLLFLMIFASFLSIEVMGQCGRVSLIGEFNGWNGDHWMDRNPENPALFTTVISLDTNSNQNGPDEFIAMKFREDGAWTVNWGSDTFPTGTGTQNGPDIPVPLTDTTTAAFTDYFVTFNCETGEYSFTLTCGKVALIGEFNGWSADFWMNRDAANPDIWSVVLPLDTNMDVSGALDTLEIKFRENANWAVNWGSTTFPSGTGVQNGPNIKVPVDTTHAAGSTTDYLVTFNCATGEYNFQYVNGAISMIGEFNGWNGDLWMTRMTSNPNLWTVVLELDTSSDGYAPTDTIGMKFRENGGWQINWGNIAFPSGIATQDGHDIMVPIDTTGGGARETDYFVTFNSATGEYSFVKTWETIGMIGAFNGWNGDVPMNRDAVDPNLWKLSRSWFENSNVKFRSNASWTSNWGNNTWPTGTGTPNGPNIPLIAGQYDVTFNSTTGAYSFVANANFCGEIGIVGDFNTWGTAVDPNDTIPTDILMVRDPMYPSQFYLEYNFTATTMLLFRLDADQTMANSWGGTFPEGPSVAGPSMPITVPGGKYQIFFNCKSGDFKFVRLGSSVNAPKVFAITVDGQLDEADWQVNQVISQVISGDAGGNPSEAYFGVTYNEDFLYIALDVLDDALTIMEMGEVFIDGNKSGGPYDANDLHLRFIGTYVVVIHPDTIEGYGLGFAVKPLGNGFTAELAIPWEALGVTATEGSQVGFDIILSDSDDGTTHAYQLAWNGNLSNYVNTSAFGDLLLGTLSCGCITLYNETVGDILLQNPSNSPTTYVGNFEMFEDQALIFRKDLGDAVKWGDDAFPGGTAQLNGPAIPAITGRYRVDFDCLSGAYNFTSEPAGDFVAYTEYTDASVTIDGDLAEYSLSYGSDIVVEGDYDNTVTWGSRWDKDNFYMGVKVVDANIFAHADPWNSDAIEYYIDGNHDRDGTYDGDFDTQMIQMMTNPFVDTVLWLKADGVQFTNWESKIVATSEGYNVEFRIGWDAFGFIPGKGRSIGFSLGNDDNDAGTGRTGQSVWYGTGNNWSNTADLGDLQLAGGPYTFGIGDVVDYSNEIVLFPNPSNGNVYLRMITDSFKGNVTLHIADIAGRTIVHEQVNTNAGNLIQLDATNFTNGMYFVTIYGENGTKAVKKLIIQ
jgi:hypothetical protein